jgi:alkaline phosphatase
MRKILLTLLLVPVALSAQPRAKNVILILADAGGLSTIAAASLHAYGAPRRLYVQRMPHIGLSDTTTASQIVSDSAAGMTAIVTGEKTHNGVISQSATAVRKKSDGAPLKTILEHLAKCWLQNSGVLPPVSCLLSTLFPATQETRR